MVERGRPRSFDRDAALASAMEVFGIAAPSLYAAFGSKEGLFREAVELYGRTEGPALWDVVEAAPTAREGIAGFLAATARAFSRPGKPCGCLVTLSAINLTGASPSVCEAMRKARAHGRSDLEVRLRRAMAEGELPTSLDAGAVAAFYLTVQQGMSIQARDGASRETLEKVARGAMAAWEPLTAR
jgi:AcrR family transcriptional regulator